MFFQSIHQMIAAGTDLSINIRRVNNNLSVAVMPRRTNLKNEAQQLMVPLLFNGTPEELDSEFLRALSTPVQKAQGILTNLEDFEKQAELAASQGKAAKSANEREPKDVREKREKMEKLLKKAEDAKTGKRYSEALTWLKQAKLLAAADKQKEIENQIVEVQKKASEGSLFAGEATPQQTASPEPQPQQVQAYQPQQPVNEIPMKLKPGDQIPMFMEQPVVGMTQQPLSAQQPQSTNGIPAQKQPDEQVQMYIEQPTAGMVQPPQVQQQWPQQPIQMQQPVQLQQPMPEQQWQQPVAMPQTGTSSGGQPQTYNPQWQQPTINISQGQYPGQPQMYVQQLQANGGQWQQPVPPQPQVASMQSVSSVNGSREYHSQPEGTESYNFDKDDESDRERLKEDPYAEFLDFPEECRLKDEAQMELVCC